MEKFEVIALLQELKAANPAVHVIIVGYYGHGDEFGDFSHFQAKDSQGNNVELFGDFLPKVQDALWNALDDSLVSFNENGAQGIIKIDLKRLSIDVEDHGPYLDCTIP